MVRRILPFTRQYETHRQLVDRARPGADRRRAALSAIVVPASRPAVNLDHAVTLARAAGCCLVVLCSRKARAAEVSELLASRSFSQAVVVDIPPGYEHELLSFGSSGLTQGESPEICENPNGDLSVKRNLGLLLARMLGWERIFFMDDDIRDVAAANLDAAVAMLGRYRSVGMRVTDFPDNSVVCHAHRETGASQDIFVSGSVLAVSALEVTGFFPEVYNEDWLFFYDDARSRRLGWSGQNATQLHYDPFDQPRRAERQEFGDVLAEGLYALLHRGAGPAEATRDYWDHFLAARRRFLEGIADRADQARPDIRPKLLDAVHTAMLCLMQIRPEMCEHYIHAWRSDLSAWQDRVAAMLRTGSADVALRELGLEQAGYEGFGPVPAGGAARARPSAPSGRVSIPMTATVDLLPGPWATKPTRGRHRKGRGAAPAAQPAEPAGPSALDRWFGPEADPGDLTRHQSYPQAGRSGPATGQPSEADGCPALEAHLITPGAGTNPVMPVHQRPALVTCRPGRTLMAAGSV